MNLSVFSSAVVCRCFSTSLARHGKRNFRKFPLFNKRGTRLFKQRQAANPDPDMTIYKYGLRDIGYMSRGRHVTVPEMVPELVVPDLTDFQLKPYVSYRAPDVVQSAFTAGDLFGAVYGAKVAADFKQGKLDEGGRPLEPSPEESLTPDQALLRARQTGADLFTEDFPGRDATGRRQA
ncbi:large ribosomal subunit protein mL41 [Bacillus rossius redtenbacheri]|uniref:large ribosomal subunit protein mL41 n=1 Tax=Bacillus rossius redtenbacheri TaxID=93214 RepID=UPI002FDCA313